ncbi:MAG: hypothetical protein V2I54_12650 [Bacteroidales bacterium]|nr:hypothetical protein [Bacteroidales bacterium]
MTILQLFLQKINRKPFWGLILLISLTTFVSCEEEISSLGENLIPESDIIQIDTTTAITFTNYVKKGDSILTESRTNYNIGINFNDYFGRIDGRFASQVVPNSFNYPYEDLESLDSLVLYLRIDSICGIENNTVFKVYELDSAILDAKEYYSDYEIENMIPNLNQINTTYRKSGDSLLIFRLSSTFSQKLTTDELIYEDKGSFLDAIQGITLIPENTDGVHGQIFNINLENNDSKITAYYKIDNVGDIDTLTFNYFFNGYKFGQYKINYQGAEINSFLHNHAEVSDSLLFIQGLGGAYSTIIMNNLDGWSDFSYSILKAELIIPAVDFSYDDQSFSPQQLFFTYTDNNGDPRQVEDYSGNYFGGTLSEDHNSFSFDISKHFRDIVNGEINDTSLDVRIVNNSSYPHRIILKNNIRLKVTYTKH